MARLPNFWNLFDKDEQVIMTEEEKAKKISRVKWASFVLLDLAFVEIWSSYQNMRMIFSMEPTYNIFTNLGRILKEGPLTFLIATIIFYLIAGYIGKLSVQNVSTSYKNVRGDNISIKGQLGRDDILSDEEKGKVFRIVSPKDIDKIDGYVFAKEKKTGKVIMKEFKNDDLEHDLSNDNIAVIGPSGQGKSTTILLTILISMISKGRNIFTIDPKGELYKFLKPILLALGYTVSLFNLIPSQLKNSDGCDFMKIIRESENPYAMADMFANTILQYVEDGSYWTKSNLNLLTLAILYVAKAKGFKPRTKKPDGSFSENYEKERTFAEVIELVTRKDCEGIIGNVIERSAGNGDRELLLKKYSTWAGGKETEQIRQSLSTALTTFQNPDILEILSVDEVDLSKLATAKKQAIFVATSPRDETYKSILTLFVNCMFEVVMTIAEHSETSSLENKLFIVLEELPQVGRIPNLEKYMSVMRGYNMALMYCAQNISQLESVYSIPGKPRLWVDLLENAALQLCLGANADTGSGSIDTKKYFSLRSGTMTIETTDTSEHRNKWIPEKVSDYLVIERTERKSIKGTPVFTPSDIAKIKKTDLFISPAAHNSCIDGRFHWLEHPTAQIKLVDEKTGKPVVYLTSNHVPKRKGGREDSLKGLKIIDGRKKQKKSAADLFGSNHQEDDEVRQDYSTYIRNIKD